MLDKQRCDIRGCKRVARYNVQSGLVLYMIDAKSDTYDFMEHMEDDNVNLNLCPAHNHPDYYY